MLSARSSFRWLVFLLVLTVGLVPLAAARGRQGSGVTPLDGTRGVGAAKVYRNLALYPVYDRAARDTGSYLTLDEGLKAKLVSVVEKGQGGEVNTLFITNRSDKPLYLMGGEVVLGGQQDRVLGQSTIVPPGKKNVPVTVFCVEHGRWNGRAEFAGSAKGAASSEIRAVAQNGAYAAKFAAAAGPVSRPAILRGAQPGIQSNAPVQQVARQGVVGGRSQGDTGRASVGSSQQQVWDKVESKNKNFRTENGTGTYRGVLDKDDVNAFGVSVGAYLKAFSAGLPASNGRKPVGVIVAVNGKVVTADVFREPGLFAKLWPKLLRAYATDAVEQTAKGVPALAPAPAKAVAFLKEAQTGKLQSVKENGSLLTRRAGKEAVSYRLLDGMAKPGAAAAPALHENVVRGNQ